MFYIERHVYTHIHLISNNSTGGRRDRVLILSKLNFFTKYEFLNNQSIPSFVDFTPLLDQVPDDDVDDDFR